MSVTVTFDGTAHTSVTGLVARDIRRPLIPDRRDTYVEVPGHAGAFLFEEKGGDREISVVFCMSAADSSTLRTNIASAAALFDLTGQRNLIFSDTSDRFWLARVADISDPKEERGYAEFTVKWRANPYAYATAVSTSSFSTSTTEPYSSTFSVTTASGADTPWILDVTPATDLTNGFSLNLNGDTLTYGTTLAAGVTLRLSTVAGITATIGSFLAMSDLSGTPGTLQNGTNSFTFDRASGVAVTALDWQWRRLYV